jgi:hypothetical protein
MVGARFKGARRVHINRVCFHTPSSLRSQDILVMGRRRGGWVGEGGCYGGGCADLQTPSEGHCGRFSPSTTVPLSEGGGGGGWGAAARRAFTMLCIRHIHRLAAIWPATPCPFSLLHSSCPPLITFSAKAQRIQCEHLHQPWH